MKTNEALGEWWSSLTVVEKERIASKIKSKATGKDVKVHYPECTKVWNEVSEEVKQRVHDHCTDDHGLLLPEWKEGKSYSF